MVEYRDPLPWKPSTADAHYLEGLVNNGLLPANTDPNNPMWMAPGSEAEPRPPPGYIVSMARLHERGFGVPAGRFIRALCHHYKVELHNLGPNSISQAAVFVAVCEGFLGSRPTGICGGISSAASCAPTASPRGFAGMFAPGASCSRSARGGRACTSPAP